MEVILDTSFILSCLKAKIDFISQLRELGFKIVVPNEVFEELKDLRKKEGVSAGERANVELALEILSNDRSIKSIKLGSRKTDDGLILKGREGVYIATLDNYIKKSVPNKVVILTSKKSIVIERD